MPAAFFPAKKHGSPVLAVAASISLLLAACAGSPKAGKAPLWVTDPAAAFPDSEWLCVVEQDVDARTAERTAVTKLAQIFRVDLYSVTTVNEQFAQAVTSTRWRKVSVSTDTLEFAQELVSTSAISGLVGLRVESWTERTGKAFANARMNRKECSARYSAMIRENEKTIAQLQEEAKQNPETFEAYQLINLAHNFALVTDNLHSLLTVIDPSAISRRPAYGNADAVKGQLQTVARTVAVAVRVSGDTGGRIATALAECFNSRGFRTNAGGTNLYTLVASFRMEDVDMGNSRNKFVRYLLDCSLKNRDGVEILSFSESGREGHLTESEAQQRAIRAAEQSIGTAGFAAKFETFLASLL